MADLEKLASDVKALPLPDRLRLAALLLENDRAKLARTIAEAVVLELSARELLGREVKL
jgi:hypothetical protein